MKGSQNNLHTCAWSSCCASLTRIFHCACHRLHNHCCDLLRLPHAPDQTNPCRTPHPNQDLLRLKGNYLLNSDIFFFQPRLPSLSSLSSSEASEYSESSSDSSSVSASVGLYASSSSDSADSFSSSLPDSGSKNVQPPCSKKPSGSSVMVFMIFCQLSDWTPSEYRMSQELDD